MAASASGKEELPYALKQLNWDSLHHFNSQNTYGYKGEERLLSDAMLQCDMCEQWFFNSEVACVPKEAAPFVPFQRNYRFSCRICTGGAEQFELQTNTWTSIVLTAIYNLLLSDDGSSLKAGEWLKVKDVVAWVQSHWGGLAAGRNQAQMLENSAVSKCLLYTQNNGLFSVSDDRTEVLLKHVAPSKLQLKPLISSAVPNLPAAGRGNARKSEPVGDNYRGGSKRKRGAGGKKGDDVKAAGSGAAAKEAKEQAPSFDEIKLPEKYRLLAVPKAEASQPQDPSIVQLSRTARAPQISLREDQNGAALTAVGYKGYRMVRATHGVSSGTYYYEVRVQESHLNEEGHARIGWSTEAGDLQAPVGYDLNSYSYRDVSGTKFHESVGTEYAEPFGPGDVIGCLLRMGQPGASRRERQHVSIKGVEYIVEEELERTTSVGSMISFYKNGVALGPAFTDVWAEVYYPAASLYKAACLTFNFGPTFDFPPADAEAFEAISSLAGPGPDDAQDGADSEEGGDGGGADGGEDDAGMEEDAGTDDEA